jgi:hypothetical protein
VTSPATRRPTSGGGRSTRATGGTRHKKSQAPESHPARQAAARVLEEHGMTVRLPDNLGSVRLFEPERWAYYGGLALLAGFGIVDWPVVIVLGVGHILAEDHHHKMLAEFADALAEA